MLGLPKQAVRIENTLYNKKGFKYIRILESGVLFMENHKVDSSRVSKKLALSDEGLRS